MRTHQLIPGVGTPCSYGYSSLWKTVRCLIAGAVFIPNIFQRRAAPMRPFFDSGRCAWRRRSCGRYGSLQNLIFEGRAFRVVFLEPGFCGVRGGEDLDVLGVADLLAGQGVASTPSICAGVIVAAEVSGQLRYRARVEMTRATSAIAMEIFPSRLLLIFPLPLPFRTDPKSHTAREQLRLIPQGCPGQAGDCMPSASRDRQQIVPGASHEVKG